MPGIGLVLRPVMRQELRQELRLSLRQQLVLAQVLTQRLAIMSDDNREAMYEIYLLERYLQKFEEGELYTSNIRGFLKKESNKKPIFPNFSKQGLNKKKKAQIAIPELASVLLKIINLFPLSVTINDQEYKKADLIVQLLKLGIQIGHAGQKPSQSLPRLHKALAQKNKFHLAFFNAYWSLLLQVANTGFEITAAVNIIDLLLEKLDWQECLSLINLIKKETQELSKALTTIDSYLPQINEEITEPQQYKIIIKILMQINRYQVTDGLEYHLNAFSLTKLVKNPVYLNALEKLDVLPEALAAAIIIRFPMTEEGILATLDIFNTLLNDKKFKKSKDAKRAVWRGLNVMGGLHKNIEALIHFSNLAQNAQDVIRGFKALEKQNIRILGGKISYPRQAVTMDEFISIMEKGSKQTYKEILGFTDEEISQLADDKTWNLLSRSGLIDMCFTYASICRQHNYAKGAELAAETLRQAMNKKFLKWRYHHDKSHKQIQFLDNWDAWTETHRKEVIIGVTHEILQRLGAIQRLAKMLAEKWEKIMGYSAITCNLDDEYKEITELLRDPDIKKEDKKKLGAQAGKIKKEYGLVKLINELISIDQQKINLLTNIDYQLNLLAQTLNSEEASFLIYQIKDLINKTNPEAVTRIYIEDSDKPYDLWQVGRIPVQTCQRWNEWGSYTNCLAAYVVDANKKVLWVRDSKLRSIARCIIRLIPLEFGRENKETVPLLLIERPYSTAWSEQIAISLLQWIIEKAGQINKNNQKPVMIALRDEQLVTILQKVLPKSKIKIRKLNIQLPESLNDFEYSDSLGGKITSGSKISRAEFHTFFVGFMSSEITD